MIALFGGAVVAALLGGPHCVGMCGPFAVATERFAVPWHLGRLLTYTSLGALAGAIGNVPWVGSRVTVGLSVLFLLYFSARLAGLVAAPATRWPALTTAGAALLRRGGWFANLGFGAISGLLPCGLLWSALALSIAAGSAALGATVLGAFWLGTLPALSFAAVALRRLAAAKPWTRKAVAIGVLAAGLASIGTRASLTAAAPSCHEAGAHAPSAYAPSAQ